MSLLRELPFQVPAVNHGDTSRCPEQPFSRESGALVMVDADGEELRLHPSAQALRWHARRWRINPIHGQWIGAQVGLGAKDLTADEWRACAAWVPFVPVPSLDPTPEAPVSPGPCPDPTTP